LERLRRQGVAVGYITRILAAFGGGADPDLQRPVTAGEATASSASQHSPPALIEPLSARELEVLQLIAEGLTNQEIAARLFLSLNTVKAHTRNIYGKLDVHNRTQAVARSQALGLLP
jgi:LuxR family maltose regulon positive regulatory protein